MTIDLMTLDKAEVTRRGPGQWLDGHYEPGQLETITIDCNVQPLNGREVEQLPEGEREKEQKWVWTQTGLVIGDVVCYKGEKYEVQRVEDWTIFCISHYKARMTRMENQNAQV